MRHGLNAWGILPNKRGWWLPLVAFGECGVLSVGFEGGLGAGADLVSISVGGEKVWLHRF